MFTNFKMGIFFYFKIENIVLNNFKVFVLNSGKVWVTLNEMGYAVEVDFGGRECTYTKSLDGLKL